MYHCPNQDIELFHLPKRLLHAPSPSAFPTLTQEITALFSVTLDCLSFLKLHINGTIQCVPWSGFFCSGGIFEYHLRCCLFQ